MQVGPDCVNRVDYSALGFTVCRPTRNKEQFLDPAAFHLNSTFRIPAEQHAPRMVGRETGESPCAGDRCYGQTAIGWTPEIAACARGARIGVISSAIDARHPAFAGAAFSGMDFTPHRAGRTAHWHGTALLALLAGNPSAGVKGLVPEATFSVADIFFADRQGQPATDVVSLLKALNWLKVQNLHVALLDMAGPRDQLLDEAISSLVKAGTALVMPASADGDAAATHPDVIAVAAVDKRMATSKDVLSSSRIDLVAPGFDIWTALPGNKYGYVSGNSFATAYVVAALAANNPSAPDDLSAQDRKEQLLLRLPVKELGADYGRGLVLAPTACTPRLMTVTPPLMRMPASDWK